jgi:hypothetical protein
VRLLIGLLIGGSCWGQLIPFPGPGLPLSGPPPSNTYTCGSTSQSTTAGSAASTLCYVINPTTGTSHTVTVSGASTFALIEVACFGITGATVGGNQISCAGGGCSFSPTPVTTINAGNLAVLNNGIGVADIGDNNATQVWSIDTSYTITDQVPLNSGVTFGGALAYRINNLGSTQNWNPNWTFSSNFTADSSMSFTSSSGTPTLISHAKTGSTAGSGGSTTTAFNSTGCGLIVAHVSNNQGTTFTVTDVP